MRLQGKTGERLRINLGERQGGASINRIGGISRWSSVYKLPRKRKQPPVMEAVEIS